MTMCKPFQLLLFHRDFAFSKACVEGGIDGLIVDFEHKGKDARQLGFDTEINRHSLADLAAIRAIKDAHILCRINGPDGNALDAMIREINDVIDAGADEIIVPMIRKFDEAQAVARAVNRRARITLMVETREALDLVADLCELPIHRIYVGLNDLRISRQSPSIFAPMIDGTLDAIRADVDHVDFGFGGLTLAGQGSPLPVAHFVDDLARQRADFTFLRRSFYRDVGDQCPTQTLDRMRQDIHEARARTSAKVDLDYNRMRAAVRAIEADQNA